MQQKRHVKARLWWRLASDITAAFLIPSKGTFKCSAIWHISVFYPCWVSGQWAGCRWTGQPMIQSFPHFLCISFFPPSLSFLVLSEIPKGAITHLNKALVWPTLPQIKQVEVTNLLQIHLVKLLNCGAMGHRRGARDSGRVRLNLPWPWELWCQWYSGPGKEATSLNLSLHYEQLRPLLASEVMGQKMESFSMKQRRQIGLVQPELEPGAPLRLFNWPHLLLIPGDHGHYRSWTWARPVATPKGESHPGELPHLLLQSSFQPLKQEAPKYPNYTGTSCSFMAGFCLLSSHKHKENDCGTLVTQTVMSVLTGNWRDRLCG